MATNAPPPQSLQEPSPVDELLAKIATHLKANLDWLKECYPTTSIELKNENGRSMSVPSAPMDTTTGVEYIDLRPTDQFGCYCWIHPYAHSDIERTDDDKIVDIKTRITYVVNLHEFYGKDISGRFGRQMEIDARKFIKRVPGVRVECKEPSDKLLTAYPGISLTEQQAINLKRPWTFWSNEIRVRGRIACS